MMTQTKITIIIQIQIKITKHLLLYLTHPILIQVMIMINSVQQIIIIFKIHKKKQSHETNQNNNPNKNPPANVSEEKWKPQWIEQDDIDPKYLHQQREKKVKKFNHIEWGNWFHKKWGNAYGNNATKKK
eukprot:303086_1